MKARTLKELLLYNYRYWFGYAIIVGFVIYFLGWQIGSLPNGLSQQEISTAAQNSSLRDIALMPLYPLHSVLQWASMQLFGIHIWSLRLPDIIIGLLVAFLLYNLLKRWFGKPTALISTALFISADWFLFVARTGTGAIEFSLWLCLALLCFTKLLEHKTKWLFLYTLALIGLLFVPFGIYAATTLVASLFACRVFRERTNEATLWIKIPCIVAVVLAFAGICFVSFKNIDFLKNLLGFASLPTLTEYGKNVLSNLSGVVAVLPNANPLVSPTGIFFVRFFELIFIAFGVIMFWRTRINRLNFTVLILSVVLAIISGLNGDAAGRGLLLIPAGIFMTAGIRHLLHRWQRTFPRNPYARIAAYLPLAILLICTVALHYASFFLLWPSQTRTYQAFTEDLPLVQQELNRGEYSEKKCLVRSDNQELNALVENSNTVCEATVGSLSANTSSFDVIIAKPDPSLPAQSLMFQVRALTSSTTSDNVRWIVVKNPSSN